MKEFILPDPEIIKSRIRDIYTCGIELAIPESEFHSFLQEKISALAGEFSLKPVKEFVLVNYDGRRNGRLDVVWCIGSTPVVAFEIDSALRKKSLRKLLASKAGSLYWVYYGNAPFASFVGTFDPSNRVTVLHFPSNFRELPARSVNCKVGEVKNELKTQKHRFVEIRKRFPNAYKKWSDEEDAKLITLMRNGYSIYQIASRLQRKPGGIRARIKKLGLKH